jgi:hypothetical protein
MEGASRRLVWTLCTVHCERLGKESSQATHKTSHILGPNEFAMNCGIGRVPSGRHGDHVTAQSKCAPRSSRQYGRDEGRSFGSSPFVNKHLLLLLWRQIRRHNGVNFVRIMNSVVLHAQRNRGGKKEESPHKYPLISLPPIAITLI